MMNFIAVSVFDVKAEQGMTPIFTQNEATAIRSFRAAVNLEGHEFAGHAEDYSLWRVGTWDSEKRELVGEVAKCLAQGFDVKERDNG